jgi:hypothetical protein
MRGKIMTRQGGVAFAQSIRQRWEEPILTTKNAKYTKGGEEEGFRFLDRMDGISLVERQG